MARLARCQPEDGPAGAPGGTARVQFFGLTAPFAFAVSSAMFNDQRRFSMRGPAQQPPATETRAAIPAVRRHPCRPDPVKHSQSLSRSEQPITSSSGRTPTGVAVPGFSHPPSYSAARAAKIALQGPSRRLWQSLKRVVALGQLREAGRAARPDLASIESAWIRPRPSTADPRRVTIRPREFGNEANDPVAHPPRKCFGRRDEGG